MVRYMLCLLLVSMALAAPGKVPHHRFNLKPTPLHVVDLPDGSQLSEDLLVPHHRFNLEPTPLYEVDLTDGSKEAGMLPEDSLGKEVDDGGDDGDLIHYDTSDVFQPQEDSSEEGPAVMSKRARLLVQDYAMTESQDDGDGVDGEDNGSVPENVDAERDDHDSKVGAVHSTGDIEEQPKADDSRKRDVTSNPSLKWPKSGNYVIVPYTTNGLDAASVSTMSEAMDDITRISCVRFSPRLLEENYVEILAGSVCMFSVGRVGGKQSLGFGSGICTTVPIATHLFYHALGFYHEHTRRDRDDFITIYWENIADESLHLFVKDDVGLADSLGYEYDPHSIMHFDNYRGTKNGRKTMDWRANSALVLSGNSLSLNDIARLNTFYGCNRDCSAFPYTTASVIDTVVLSNQLTAGLRLLKDLPNADIAQRFYSYITQCQYPNYYATVVVYQHASGNAYRSFRGFGLTYRLGAYDRDFVVYTKLRSEPTHTVSKQRAVLDDVLLAVTNRGCNAQVSRDRAWDICHPRGCRFVHVIRDTFRVAGYYLENTMSASYTCERRCVPEPIGCIDLYETISIGF